MDWLRRNWPDVLIGIALLVVIAGIVSTLLTGGSPFPFGSGNRAAPPAQTPPAFEAPREEDDSEAAPPILEEDSVPSPTVEPLPLDEPSAPDASESEAAPAVEPVESEAAPTAAPEPAPEPAPAQSAADVTPSDNPSDPYRVSVGAFGARENAERQAVRFRDAGYPVFLASQGDFTIVLVGPYASEAEARVVRDAIDASEPDVDPIIYMYSEEEDREGESTAPSPQPAADEPASADAGEAPVAAQDEGGTRLQVGAFDDRSSAQPTIDRLEAIGFNVDEVNENGMLKLVVGPFAGDALESARSLLDQAGFEHFAR